MSDDGIEITRGRDELLDEVRPLWLALRTHHGEIAPGMGPVRDDEGTWARRRAQYEGWLADARCFLLLARRDGRAIAYAFVRPDAFTSVTWDDEGTRLDLETLSVLPEARGTGLGARLIALVRDEVERGGYDGLTLTAVATNRDALRFYEREGFTPQFVTLRDTRRRP
ncbi:MAG: GCN5-related N-acetyltransferase [Conexibacter sp.]|nr:GCN5-related N-acetyltransferase [Conexibacter sp.]